MFLNRGDGVLINGSTNVIEADLAVTNGVVHVVDELITLPTVVILAATNPTFTNLAVALTQEELIVALSNTATTGMIPAPFTVFAPTNAAFQALIDADPNDGINPIEDITDGLEADPITEGTFVLNTTAGVTIIDGSDTVTNVIVTNVTATNGVVHAIDFVLRPM